MVVDSNPEMAVQCNPQLGQVEILPLPTIIGETAILRLEFEERVQHRLTRHLLSYLLGKITISSFN